MAKYRKKPIIIEAEQFTEKTKDRVFNFVTCNKSADFDTVGKSILKIQTLEGVMTASLGDYVIKGISGEFYPCKADIFKTTYDLVE